MPDVVNPGNPLDPRATPRTIRKARHILDNYYITTARDPDVLEIWAYTNRLSYAPGDIVHLHVNTTGRTWNLEIGRDGADYEPLLYETDLPGQYVDTPEDCSVSGCDWPVAYEFSVPDDWPPGGYLVTLNS